jgi:hypothetical protein
VTITPAYGRDYTSKKAVIADFEADKDFIIADFHNRDNGRYINKSGLVKAGYKAVNIRYKKMTQVAVISLFI